MPSARRLLVACLGTAVAALLLLPGAAVAAAEPAATASAAKKKAGKRCGKGKKKGKATKSAARKGKRCGKGKKKAATPTVPGPTPPSCVPGVAGCPFPAPGRVLEGEEAKSWVGKYLANSTFTDCPAGWPSCAVEQRYSHSAGNEFHYCRLTPSPGSDIRSAGEYGLQAARVEADGTWIARVVTHMYGNYSLYEWKVSPNGAVTGAYQFQPESAIEQIGPLQYLGGVAKDCG